ncbi:MAG: dockerin type I domain-containing protein, partial [Tepidisphaerales bacterium]
VVDEKDYLAVIANMGKTNGQWFLGDVNCDGVVDASDFAEVSAHLGDRVAAAFEVSADEGVGGTLAAAKAKPVVTRQKVQEFKGSKVQGGKGSVKVVKRKRPAAKEHRG